MNEERDFLLRMAAASTTGADIWPELDKACNASGPARIEHLVTAQRAAIKLAMDINAAIAAEIRGER